MNVHTPYEGELPGTDLFIAFDRIRDERERLPGETATPIAVYCRSGRMSSDAARTLAGLGYTNVVELQGGMDAWEASGRSVELIPVSGGARYATESGDPLQFGTTPADTSFSIVGPALRLSRASQQLAWFNLGAGISDADAYTLANVRTATTAAGNATPFIHWLGMRVFSARQLARRKHRSKVNSRSRDKRTCIPPAAFEQDCHQD